MSKPPCQTSEDDLPPPYSPQSPSTPGPSTSITSIFTSHLNNLPLRITSAQTARTSVRDQRDNEILTLLVPHMEHLLSSITAMDPPPRCVEAIMIPGDAVGQDWTFSDDDQPHTLIRVYEDRKLDSDVKKSSSAGDTAGYKPFDEWGRWEDDTQQSSHGILWWADANLASRLAKYIQPQRLDRQTVKAQVSQSKKSARWGLFKKNDTHTPPPPPPPPPPVEQDPVTMTVKAEEVTFRKENSMGIWEARTGWGLAIRVRIRQ